MRPSGNHSPFFSDRLPAARDIAPVTERRGRWGISTDMIYRRERCSAIAIGPRSEVDAVYVRARGLSEPYLVTKDTPLVAELEEVYITPFRVVPNVAALAIYLYTVEVVFYPNPPGVIPMRRAPYKSYENSLLYSAMGTSVAYPAYAGAVPTGEKLIFRVPVYGRDVASFQIQGSASSDVYVYTTTIPDDAADDTEVQRIRNTTLSGVTVPYRWAMSENAADGNIHWIEVVMVGSGGGVAPGGDPEVSYVFEAGDE